MASGKKISRPSKAGDPLSRQFAEVASLIQAARARAWRAVDSVLVELHWQIGEYISARVASSQWGEGTVDKLAEYLESKLPDIKGFNRRGLYRMKQFYEMYSPNPIVSPLVTQISWTNNLLIMSKCNELTEREFYIRLCIRDSLSKRELERQIDSRYYLRAVRTPHMASALMDAHPGARDTFRDSYSLEFLGLSDPHSEADLRKAIVRNLKQFILEFGRDFAFVGEEYRVQVGMKDFFIDLLFYHRDLCCLIAFDLLQSKKGNVTELIS